MAMSAEPRHHRHHRPAASPCTAARSLSSLTVNGNITGTGNLTKGGGAVIMMNSDNAATYSGNWNVIDGALGTTTASDRRQTLGHRRPSSVTQSAMLSGTAGPANRDGRRGHLQRRVDDPHLQVGQHHLDPEHR